MFPWLLAGTPLGDTPAMTSVDGEPEDAFLLHGLKAGDARGGLFAAAEH